MDRECSTALKRIPGKHVFTKTRSECQNKHFVLLAVFHCFSFTSCLTVYFISHGIAMSTNVSGPTLLSLTTTGWGRAKDLALTSTCLGIRYCSRCQAHSTIHFKPIGFSLYPHILNFLSVITIHIYNRNCSFPISSEQFF